MIDTAFDFALTCLFVVLAYEQYRNRREWWPCVVALVMFVVAKHVTQQYLLLLAYLCVLAIVLRSVFWAQGARNDGTNMAMVVGNVVYGWGNLFAACCPFLLLPKSWLKAKLLTDLNAAFCL